MLYLTRALATACLLGLVMSPAVADLYCNFESGLGRNGQPIAGDVPGMLFSTSAGGHMLYADINSGWYSVTSDNGKVFEDGEYFVSGDVAAYVLNPADSGKVSFPFGPASYVTVGYSSQFAFVIEAYDSSNYLLTSAAGPSNTKQQGGSGLSYLTVTHPGIDHILMRDQGGYWMIDNITTNAPIPEPASIVVMAAALAGLIARRRT